ncbi:hypothetical protein D3C87_1180930 [compost metagenome]
MVAGLGPPRRVEVEEALLPVAFIDPPIVAESTLIKERRGCPQQVVGGGVAIIAVILGLIGHLVGDQHLAEAQAMVVLIIELALLVDLTIEVDVGGAPGLVAQADAGTQGFGIARPAHAAKQHAAIDRQRAAGAAGFIAQCVVPHGQLHVL